MSQSPRKPCSDTIQESDGDYTSLHLFAAISITIPLVLELKFNTLAFNQVARAEPDPDQQLLEYERLCLPEKFAWVWHIELNIEALVMPCSPYLGYFRTSDHLEVYMRVAKFCRKYLNITAKYVINSFSWHPCFHMAPESRGFINQGIVLRKALYNIDLGALNPRQAIRLLDYGKDLRQGKKTTNWDATNMKFYPDQDKFNEQTFRRCAERSFDDIEGGLEKWIEVAKSWIEDGF
jgi:hypothetical protein